MTATSLHPDANIQVASQASPNWAAGALLMVSEALRAHPSLWSALQQPEDHEDEQERFRDITDRCAGTVR